MKRALITIAIIILIIGTVGAIYFFFFLPSAPHLAVGNPFGDTGSGTVGSTTTPTGEAAQGAGTQVAPNLVEITAGPVAEGFVSFDVAPTFSTTTSLEGTSTNGSTIVSSSTPGDVEIRYIDRESGNVYEYGALSRTLTRLSDKTLPGSQQASWLSDGSIAFVRFLASVNGSEELNTYALPFDGNGGYFLQEGLDEAVVTPSNTLFTLEAGTDSSVGTVMHADGTNSQTVFTSPLAGLHVFPTANGYIAATKAASELQGYAFTIGSTGSFIPILGPLDGLTILPSPSGNLILYSYTDGTELHMGVLNLSTGSETPLPIATLAEKCVWTSDESSLYCAIPTSFNGNLPDDWYQGAVSFSDRIWNINLNSRLATLVLDPTSSVKSGIDAISLTLDANSQILTFMNKKDGSLWAYTL